MTGGREEVGALEQGRERARFFYVEYWREPEFALHLWAGALSLHLFWPPWHSRFGWLHGGWRRAVK